MTQLSSLMKQAQEARDAEKRAREALQQVSRPAQEELAAATLHVQDLEQKIRAARERLVLDNIDVLLLLRPEHDRTSCSDTDFHNSGRCGRCALLRAKDYGFLDNIDVSVTVTNRS